MKQRSVFLSYSESDEPRARVVATALEAAGFRVSDVRARSLATKALTRTVSDALRSADVVIALVTDGTSPNVFIELGMAAYSRKPSVIVLPSEQRSKMPLLVKNQLTVTINDWARVADVLVPAVEFVLARRAAAALQPTLTRKPSKATEERARYHVRPVAGKGWEIARGGRTRGVFSSKGAAVSSARALARSQRLSEVVIHARDGRVTDTSTVLLPKPARSRAS